MQQLLILSFVSMVVYINAVQITSIEPHYGSLEGHTLVTIVGEGFFEDFFHMFNVGVHNEYLGIQVYFVSDTRSYGCDVFHDGCHDTQLQCFTRAMPEDHYSVRVTVNGVDVPLEQHCGWEQDPLCGLETRLLNTPVLRLIEPSSAAPGSILSMHGKLLTTRVFSSDDASVNGTMERIIKVDFGLQSCNLISDPLSNTLYGIGLNSDNEDEGWFKCKLEGSYIGNMNASFVISGPYGRSRPDLSELRVSNTGQPYMFQSYAVIHNIVPNVGSVVGGTKLHIEGNYFHDPAKVSIGDEACGIINPVTQHEIVCTTPLKPLELEYPISQVTVHINDISSACMGDCSFQWQEDSTPIVNSVHPNSGSSPANTVLTIGGSNLDEVSNDTSTVIIGGSKCMITSHSDTEILCNVGSGHTGTHDVIVTIAGKGFARHTGQIQQFTYSGDGEEVNYIYPSEGSYGGNMRLSIIGIGFASESEVTVGGEHCPVISYNHTVILCLVPAKVSLNPDISPVIVSHPSGDFTSPVDFYYSITLTPIVHSINVTESLVLGGDTMAIVGSNLKLIESDNRHVVLGLAEAEILSHSDTEIIVSLPPNAPGKYKLIVSFDGIGFADVDMYNIPLVSYILQVDAIQPLYGSLMGGTRLTIEGSGFPGDHSSAVDVKVGNVDCQKETVTTTQIICKTGHPGTVHNVTNLGTHPTYGERFAWQPAVLNVKEGDTVHWEWTVPNRVEQIGYQVIQTHNSTSDIYKPEGFRSCQKEPTGSFAHTFTVPGNTYYYSSGPVDEQGAIVMRGVINVLPLSSNTRSVSVMLAQYTALYNTDSGVEIIPQMSTNTSICSIDNIEDYSQGGFQFTSLDCLMAVVDEIWPNELRLDEFLYLRGSGFSTDASENEVKIGLSITCIVIESSESEIKCLPDIADELVTNMRLPVSLQINKLGNAKINIDSIILNTVAFKPYIENITPNVGSLAGGTYVTITGAGFPTQPNNLQVSLSGESCTIVNVTYAEIICETGMHTESFVEVEVSLTENGLVTPIHCTANNCGFQYTNAVTTQITAIAPVSMYGLMNTLTLSGDFQLVTLNNIDVNIGEHNCYVNSLSSTSLSCEIENLPSGVYELRMRTDPHGYADISTDAIITANGALSNVSPNIGSLNGGTKITISGSVFAPNYVLETSVNIGSNNICMIEYVSYDTIVCVTFMETVSSIKDIIVETNGKTITGHNITEFSDAATPKITSISPDTASIGGSMTISGSGFSTNSQDNRVQIGNHSCNITGSSTSNLIQCNFDAIAANIYSVELLVEGVGLSTTDGIQFTFQPSVATIYPAAGSFGGGQLVTISGTGFDVNHEHMIITICSEACNVLTSSVQEILCMTPLNTGTGSVSCDVSVSVNALTDTLTSAFTYEETKTPVISSVYPRRVQTGGGTRLTIIGDRFGNVASDIQVTIADSDCIVNSHETNSTYVVCVTEPSSNTLETKINLQISDYGMASQENADIEYINVWSSISSWGGTSLPIEGDTVVIKQTMLLDTDTPVLKTLHIQGGSLIFDRKDIKLNAEKIIVTNGGLFQVGTEEDPFLHQATITLHGHSGMEKLLVYGGKVLAVREGTLDLHGRHEPITWTHLSKTASSGTIELEVQQPVNWSPGDQVVISTTGRGYSPDENELRQIVHVSEDGFTITLNESLKYSHISTSEDLNGISVVTSGEVGLLSHNIRIQGSNNAKDHDEIKDCPSEFEPGQFQTQACFQGKFGDEIGSGEFGPQIMIHAPAPEMRKITVRIEYVQLTDGGQEFRIGKYPVHFHLLGDMRGSYVRGCGIQQSSNRAINIYGTDNLLIEHNVAYNIKGGAYVLEGGITTGNTFQYNLAVGVKPSNNILNDDVTPASFWVNSPNNILRHNVAAGGTHFGFWYQMFHHQEGTSFPTNDCPQKVPLDGFVNNTAHSFGRYGLWIFPSYHPTHNDSCNSINSAQSIFLNFTAWHCEKGAALEDVSNLQFGNFHLISNELAGIQFQNVEITRFDNDLAGIDIEMMKTSKWIYARVTNSFIKGYSSTSASSECTHHAIVLPNDSGLIVENVTFVNFDRNCQVFGVSSITGKGTIQNGGFHCQTKGLAFVNAPNHAHWDLENQGEIEDQDGSLTGTVNAKVVPSSGILPPSLCVVRSEFSFGDNVSVCQPSVTLIRFAFNQVNSPSLRFEDAILTNEFGSSSVPWRSTGWLLLMPTAHEYEIAFENAGHVTNISYDGVFYGLREEDYVVITMSLSAVPDIVTIRSGESRPQKLSMVTYSNSVDGDWYFDVFTNKLSYLISGRVSENSTASVGIKDSAVSLRVQKWN